MDTDDPGGFVKRAIADFAGKLSPTERDKAREEFRRLHLSPLEQMRRLAEMLDRRWHLEVPLRYTDTMRDQAREARERILGEHDSEREPALQGSA